MLAPRGTPILAVVDGLVKYEHNTLGGNAAVVLGGSGRYYYAHMDHYQGSDRAVHQGDVIGYVGDTGDARGTHAHRECEQFLVCLRGSVTALVDDGRTQREVLLVQRRPA